MTPAGNLIKEVACCNARCAVHLQLRACNQQLQRLSGNFSSRLCPGSGSVCMLSRATESGHFASNSYQHAG